MCGATLADRYRKSAHVTLFPHPAIARLSEKQRQKTALLMYWKPRRGLLKSGSFRQFRWDMTGRTGSLANRRTGAAILAAVLLLCGQARAQSSGGPFSLFDNIFTGSLSKGGPAAPSSQRPGTSAQAQAAPGAS